MDRYPEYKESSVALINQAVTKGLDPNVEMKPSGVKWIGDIPAHWEVKRLKHIAKILPSNVDKHIYPDEIQVRLCNYTDVYYNDYITVDTVLQKGSCEEREFAKFVLRKGDVIITKDSETPDDIGVPTFVKDDLESVVCGYHLTMIRSCACRGEFIFRFIQSDRTRRYFELESNGITRYGLGKSSIENLLVPIPTDFEQQQIADFLNNKTQQIDELIRIKERRIELLQEQRTALINQVVTKGLNPNVEMKPSGVEWIGEIPVHWAVKRIKYLASLISKGTTPTTMGREILDEGEIRFIKVENIVDNKIELNPEYYIDEETNETLQRSQLKENDLLFVIAGATIGKVGLVKPNYLPANTNQAVSFIRPNEKEFPKFIYYWLQSDNIQKVIWLKAVQSAQPNLSMEDLGNLYIPYPSIAEQCQIVEYITDKMQTIVQLLQQAYEQIELLREYRQSLISEAVTGKIDVRNRV